MSSESSMPASIGASRSTDEGTADSGVDSTLVRLYTALKELDVAIYDALRALDVALGRDPSTGPPEALPYRELGRLKNKLEAATGAARHGKRPSLGEIALRSDADDDTESGDDGTAEGNGPGD